MATSDDVYAAAARRITAHNPALSAPYGARRSRFALFTLLLASHLLACLAGAYVAAKAAESAPADVCPVSAPARAQVWL